MTASSALRTGRALLGATGALMLAGCSSLAGNGAPAPDTSELQTRAAAPYADGTYTAEGSYRTPETVETVSVTLTVQGDEVTGVDVVGDPTAPESKRYQGEFIAGIAGVVVGKKLDELDVDRVAGSSLTSGGFNQAVVKIKDAAVTALAE